MRKPNLGYDFGSWSFGLQAFPQIRFADEVLLINDSLAGPFGKMDKLLTEVGATPFDITGLCDSIQFQYHIQSFFIHFKNSSLTEESIWHFWCNVYHFEKKDDVIHQYEIGFTELAAKVVRVGAIFPFNLTKDRWGASTLSSAKTFLELGNPFLKRELIRNLKMDEAFKLRDLVREKFELEEFDLNNLYGVITPD
jgi:lipopolysaccharide biosynthesis protein